jgi:hypothetical protein
MEHLTTSLQALRTYLDTTPKAEVQALITKIDNIDFGGPTVDQYLGQLDTALQLNNWLGKWPTSKERPACNWGFETMTKVTFEESPVTYPPATYPENQDLEFVEMSICEAA